MTKWVELDKVIDIHGNPHYQIRFYNGRKFPELNFSVHTRKVGYLYELFEPISLDNSTAPHRVFGVAHKRKYARKRLYNKAEWLALTIARREKLPRIEDLTNSNHKPFKP